MSNPFNRLAAVLLLCSAAAFPAEPAPKPAVSEATMKLLSEAQTIAKGNKPEEAAAAYARVLSAGDLTIDQRINAHLDLARVYLGKSNVDAAAAEHDKALAIADLTQAQRLKLLNAKGRMYFDSNFQGAWSSYYTAGIERAAEVYRTIIKTPGFTNGEKITAYQLLANCYLELMNMDSANKTLAEALTLPDLKDADVFSAKKNIADSLYRQLDYSRALAAYRELWAAGLHVHVKEQIENRIVSILVATNKAEEAGKCLMEWNARPLRIARLHMECGKREEAQKICGDFLGEKRNNLKERIEAAEMLLQIIAEKGDCRLLIEEAERAIPPLIAEGANAWTIYSRLPGWQFAKLGINSNDEFLKWVSEKIISAPKVALGEFLKHSEVLLNIALRRRDYAGAKGVVGKILESKDLTPKSKLQYEIHAAILNSEGKPAGIVNEVNNVIKSNDTKEDDLKAKAETLLFAARCAMSAQYYDVATELSTAREKMLVHDARRSTKCTFIEKGPKDITEFMNSEYFRDKKNRASLDRKYGENLQFLLETDAALTGRKVTEKDANFTPTEFVATCDEECIRFFFFASNPKARDVADGLAAAGGYEMYLASGPDMPYHCYLIDFAPNGMNDDFVTQYNNANFRRARQKENTARIEHRMYDNGIATLLSISWEAFFNQLPKDGDQWDFEPLHWEQGGYSWGGSKSVHNRSSFGSLVFSNMTKENLNSIKRRLISKAANAYKKEVSPQNGYVEIWQDPELGDQKFHIAAIKPLQDRLDKYLEKVKPGLTLDDVELLYSEAVPQWMNIKFIVADLRRNYLEEQRVGGR
jgi:hypothetical protein